MVEMLLLCEMACRDALLAETLIVLGLGGVNAA